MLSQTRRALEDFDNQHDFERMAADILNGLGYSNVEPMAPRGGPDGGRDIKFMEGDTPGIAFVTLEKNIKRKFKQDLEKQDDAGDAGGVISLFCDVDVSPSLKLGFAKDAIAKRYRIEVFDLERLRSLLDSNLKEVRRRYLKIDDELAVQLRSEISKLLRFPDAIPDVTHPPTLIETLLLDKQPRRIFDVLMRFEEKDILEVPGIGEALHNHLKSYYRFRQRALRLEEDLLTRVGRNVEVRFPVAWKIYLKYTWMRFGGLSKDNIVAGGNFLNYGITWDDAERVFINLAGDGTVSSAVTDLLSSHKSLSNELVGWRDLE